MKTMGCFEDDKATFEGFLEFVTILNLGIDNLDDPSSAEYRLLYLNYRLAVRLVPCALLCIDPYLYKQAIYNYAIHVFITLCFDINLDYLDKTKLINMGFSKGTGWRNGIVQAASDQATSVSYMTPEFYKNMSLNDFELLRTPFGREYEKLIQQVGTIWGLTSY
ncbi:hypothetical protein [Commensalibacter nepenthis]|uniref:Uncharacterized protein n=1 Tax=Commensalibacter nepenthis TaxID=3043872 RepID=A0ABT6Q828_9PROT|nr:hypothetical protein [Commensalibacter sp. TBRC 10068]MDI2113066.1 hypothetical protein [Commensalibacter sp. TBRC 10068]